MKRADSRYVLIDCGASAFRIQPSLQCLTHIHVCNTLSVQLFGDSVNTAARMEQNGIAGRIHVSQACADVLRASGKDKWLVQREEKIHAKGLGELNTFWVVIGKEAETMTCHSHVSGISCRRSTSTPVKTSGSDEAQVLDTVDGTLVNLVDV